MGRIRLLILADLSEYGLVVAWLLPPSPAWNPLRFWWGYLYDFIKSFICEGWPPFEMARPVKR